MVRKGAQQQVQDADMAAEGTSSHNLRDQLTVYVGKPKVTAVEEVRQALVVQAQQMEQRGMDVVVVHNLLGRLIAKLVGGADDLPALDAGAGHPKGHGAGVVVAPDAALRYRHPSELGILQDR